MAPMSRPTAEPPVMSWPNLRTAAEILRVAPGTLSKRHPEAVEAANQLRLSPTSIVMQAAYFRRRPLADVGADLVAHAREQAHSDEAAVREVETEVVAALERFRLPARLTPEGLLESARKVLAPRHYEALVAQLEAESRGERERFPGTAVPLALERGAS